MDCQHENVEVDSGHGDGTHIYWEEGTCQDCGKKMQKAPWNENEYQWEQKYEDMPPFNS